MSQGFPRPIAARQLILSTLPWTRTQASNNNSSSSVQIPESVIGFSGVRIYCQTNLTQRVYSNDITFFAAWFIFSIGSAIIYTSGQDLATIKIYSQWKSYVEYRESNNREWCIQDNLGIDMFQWDLPEHSSLLAQDSDDSPVVFRSSI